MIGDILLVFCELPSWSSLLFLLFYFSLKDFCLINKFPYFGFGLGGKIQKLAAVGENPLFAYRAALLYAGLDKYGISGVGQNCGQRISGSELSF